MDPNGAPARPSPSSRRTSGSRRRTASKRSGRCGMRWSIRSRGGSGSDVPKAGSARSEFLAEEKKRTATTRSALMASSRQPTRGCGFRRARARTLLAQRMTTHKAVERGACGPAARRRMRASSPRPSAGSSSWMRSCADSASATRATRRASSPTWPTISLRAPTRRRAPPKMPARVAPRGWTRRRSSSPPAVALFRSSEPSGATSGRRSTPICRVWSAVGAARIFSTRSSRRAILRRGCGNRTPRLALAGAAVERAENRAAAAARLGKTNSHRTMSSRRSTRR